LPHVGLEGYQGAFLFRARTVCIVSVPPAWVEPAQAALSGHTTEEVFAPQFLEGAFGDAVDCLLGPAWLGYADATDFAPAPTEAVRLLEPSDERAFRRLAEQCDATEWEHSGLEGDRPPVCGCFREGELVAAAGYTIWGEKLAHVGVVTHSSHRGHGYGKAVVSGITAHALRQGLIAQYRTLQSNAPSIAIGRALGFQEYGVTLAVRFR
jgi:RimJ/RimL family protein N-acetyltransferase